VTDAGYPRFQPKSRKAWRAWLQKNHASSNGAWLIYAKKHTGLPSLTYNDAVEEALCFGWIDSKVNSIDDALYMQVFTPRKPTSAWSALNKARIERLVAAGLMTAAGLALVKIAKRRGTWAAADQVDALAIPSDLRKAIDANPDAKRNWTSYSLRMRKGFLNRVAAAKRPETRARHVHDIVEIVARNMSRSALMERSGFRPRAKLPRTTTPV
jgi:uncharacterized protein YdeI (YjbR/CyaY-like superfamily)